MSNSWRADVCTGRVLWALALAGVLSACSGTSGETDPVATAVIDPPATVARALDPPDTAPEAPPNGTATPSNMCEVVQPPHLEDIIVSAAVLAPDVSLTVGEPRPLPGGECSFPVERSAGGSSFVQVRSGDDFDFGHHRDVEDVTDLPGLGEEAYSFYGVAGPELHVRVGSAWIGVRFGSYDDQFGLTEDSHARVATLVADLLTAS